MLFFTSHKQTSDRDGSYPYPPTTSLRKPYFRYRACSKGVERNDTAHIYKTSNVTFNFIYIYTCHSWEAKRWLLIFLIFHTRYAFLYNFLLHGVQRNDKFHKLLNHRRERIYFFACHITIIICDTRQRRLPIIMLYIQYILIYYVHYN